MTFPRITNFDDIAPGVMGSMRTRPGHWAKRPKQPYTEPTPCTVVDLDRDRSGQVKWIVVRDEATGTEHKLWKPASQKTPGVWHAGTYETKQKGPRRVVLCDPCEDVMSSRAGQPRAPRRVDLGDDD